MHESSSRERVDNARSVIKSSLHGLPRTPREAVFSLQLAASLREQGWHRSTNNRAAVDTDGNSIPWLTYPAIEWLDRTLTGSQSLFEYGAGASTSWLASRVAKITSVESDPEWFNKLDQPSNGEILLRECDGTWWEGSETDPYVSAVEAGAPWDVIIVDGMARNACARAALRSLADGGMVVLDDTGLETCADAIEIFRGAGMRRLDFWGIKPAVGIMACTSIFTSSVDRWIESF